MAEFIEKTQALNDLVQFAAGIDGALEGGPLTLSAKSSACYGFTTTRSLHISREPSRDY